jgi:hypothetical protein
LVWLKQTFGVARMIGRLEFVVALLLLWPVPLAASDCCDPNSPFRPGEGWADKEATCATLEYWAARAPKSDDRVTMIVRGKLSKVGSNDVLAYLEMCDPKGLRVVCVTYQTNGMRAGDIVTFAGGYRRSSVEWVMLDPCLASK